MRSLLIIPLLRRAALPALAITLAGCVVHEDRVARVERRPVVVRQSNLNEAPPPPVEESTVDDATDDVFEPAPAEAVATYEPDLNPHGEWVVTEEYGRCWVPRARPVGWRPYTVGTWVSTDAGLSFAAEGPEAEWGVITYHYGRWYEHPSRGWLWVPGTTWAPAWVAWRNGGGYSGWAPLPPRIGYRRSISAVYVERAIPADRYVFVEQRHLCEPHVSSHVVVNNVTIVKKTTNITNITYVNNRVVNRGVSVTEIEKSSGRHINTVHTTEVTTATEARRLRSEGKVVAYVPPKVAKADVEYRDRVERRNADLKAERDRVSRRATDADKAEHDRAVAREKEAALAKEAEKNRVERRTADAAALEKAEHERALKRAKDEELAKAAEHDRALKRAKEEEATKAAEHERALKRAKEESDAKAKAAAVERSKIKTPPDTKTTTATDAAKAAEHERALRRAKEEEDAKAKAAEHERALRRAKEEADAKAKADANKGK